MSKVDIGAILGVVKTVVSSEAGQSYVCGTYFDGMPCSISIGEAWHDGYISPKDRLRWAEEQNKKVKEKRKQRKKQKKKAKKAKKNDFVAVNKELRLLQKRGDSRSHSA